MARAKPAAVVAAFVLLPCLAAAGQLGIVKIADGKFYDSSTGDRFIPSGWNGCVRRGSRPRARWPHRRVGRGRVGIRGRGAWRPRKRGTHRGCNCASPPFGAVRVGPAIGHPTALSAAADREGAASRPVVRARSGRRSGERGEGRGGGEEGGGLGRAVDGAGTARMRSELREGGWGGGGGGGARRGGPRTRERVARWRIGAPTASDEESAAGADEAPEPLPCARPHRVCDRSPASARARKPSRPRSAPLPPPPPPPDLDRPWRAPLSLSSFSSRFFSPSVSASRPRADGIRCSTRPTRRPPLATRAARTMSARCSTRPSTSA